jgi:uncharacterized protein
MQCPNCVTETLTVTRRQDVEIDHCPKCSGVWLDRGELDKLLQLDAEQMRRPRRYEETGEDQDEQDRIQRRGRQYNQYEDEDGEDGSEGDGGERDDLDQPGGRSRSRRDDYERERPTYGRDDSRDRSSRDRYDRPSSGGDEQIDLKSIWRDILENLGGGRPPVK